MGIVKSCGDKNQILNLNPYRNWNMIDNASDKDHEFSIPTWCVTSAEVVISSRWCSPHCRELFANA